METILPGDNIPDNTLPDNKPDTTQQTKPLQFDYLTVTAETFQSVAPFEYLYMMKNDKFKLQTELNRMRIAGKNVGVTNVKALWDAYVSSVKSVNYKSDSVMTYDDQNMELYSGSWICNEMGVFREDYQLGTVYACTHPIMPVERIINVDTGCEKIRIAYKLKNKWRNGLIIEKSTLASPQKIIELSNSGVSVTSDNAKQLIKFLQEIESLNYDAIPEKFSSTRLGWIDDYGFAPYVDDLIFDGDVNFRNIFHSVRSVGKLESWLTIATQIRRMDVVCRIALAASFASAILKPCDALSFFVHMWSDVSSTGKTVVLMAASSVWGDPSMGAYTQSFNATTVSMERTAEFFNSMPLVLDELQLAKDTHGNMRFDVYKLAQGLGKGRGTKTGGIEKTPTWNLCILTSGETPITNMTDGAGAFARVVEIEIEQIIIDAEVGNRIVSGIKQNYGHAGKRFIEILNKIGVPELKAMYEKKIRQVLSQPDVQEKQGMAAAALLLADEIASEYIFQDDSGLTLQELKPFLLSKEQTSVNDRAYELLLEWIAANANRFESNMSVVGVPDNGGVQYGTIEDNTAYIINAQFNKLMQDNGYNPRSVLSAFRKNGLIETYSECGKKRNSVKKTINRTQVWCVALKLSRDDEIREYQSIITNNPFDL